jgi:xanthine dehydrogenase YagS FAD-binding subunit
MNSFTLTRVRSVEDALRAAQGNAKFVAGGTTLVDLMKLDVERPAEVIDINSLPLAEVARTPDGGLRIGALARNSDVAHHPDVVRDFPLLSQALLAGASPQLRNMASTGGNLLQRTRCVYFRDTAMACNKRSPGSGCAAIGGFNRNLAILGTSAACIATNPSDQNVALAALGATVNIAGRSGDRSVPIESFYVLPGQTPERETVLEPGELVTEVMLPAPAVGSKSVYLKLRDRASYEFALVSAAINMTVENDAMRRVRVAMGGIATTPWRDPDVEASLEGRPAARERFERAAAVLLAEAKPQSQNGFKVELARRCLVRALSLATGLA